MESLESSLPEDVLSSMSGIPLGCDGQGCGFDLFVCQDSSPRLLEWPPGARRALKIPGVLPNVSAWGCGGKRREKNGLREC